LAEAQAGKRAVYFIDAAHFVLATFLGSLWSSARLFVRASAGRRRYNVLGAINAMTHELVRVTNEGYINSQSVCELLGKIAAQSLGVPITVVLDNAPYQRCRFVQDMAAALHLELLFLPSYSPNLNLIERLWRFTKKTVLNSRHHASFAHFCQTINQCLDELPTTHRESLKTLMTPRFQTFENVPLTAAYSI
jgi:transposase